jgi:hypothetical protein
MSFNEKHDINLAESQRKKAIRRSNSKNKKKDFNSAQVGSLK